MSDDEVRIPLLPEHYHISSIADEEDRFVGWGSERKKQRFRLHDRNLVTYDLAPRLKDIAEGEHLGIRRTSDGVVLCVRDHSLARGLVVIIRGWETMATVRDRDVAEIEEGIKANCMGGFVRSTFLGQPRSAFNFEFEEDAHWVKLRYDDVQIVNSTLLKRLEEKSRAIAP